jgi:hypothetical protein
MKNNGEIQMWEYEPDTFEFHGIKRGCRFYTPDFKITWADGSVTYHEVKGWMDAKSATKLKRMGKYYPTVKVELVQKERYDCIRKQMSGIIKNWE